MNDALADILDRQAAESESEQLLGALVDHGVFVPVHANGSVVFLKGSDDEPVLPGFVSEACCADKLPDAAGSVHCDALRLVDITQQTGVGGLALHSDHGWARVPTPLLLHTLRQRGLRGAGQELLLRPTTHPVALALREALGRRLPEFPAIRAVWVSQARWRDTGAEHLMLHLAVDEPLPSASGERLMEVLLAEVPLGDEAPQLGTLALNVATHADSIAELDALELDPVRAPQQRPKRWWRR
ncbi:hypothetical protein [Lentzea sp. NPDC051838]|uniref:hypothetical protein n=1 Tax=Lentzea sp. NPDC051838 TaxID=3154849 RepID=UPI00341D0479